MRSLMQELSIRHCAASIAKIFSLCGCKNILYKCKERLAALEKCTVPVFEREKKNILDDGSHIN